MNTYSSKRTEHFAIQCNGVLRDAILELEHTDHRVNVTYGGDNRKSLAEDSYVVEVDVLLPCRKLDSLLRKHRSRRVESI